MTVTIVGTLDTKAPEIAYAREVLESQNVATHIVDVGIMDDPGLEPDTSAAAVASAAGESLSALRETGDRGAAIDAMGRGAATIVSRQYDSGSLKGVFGLGGSGNTSIATAAMRTLPVGVPKLMVSTMASGDTEPYVGAHDVAMFYPIADIEGLNRVTRTVISNAASAMAGMVMNDAERTATGRPTIGCTMFGVTTPCVQQARERLEKAGYETIVFHATGTGGKALERLIEEGVIDAVLDITTTELADEFVGGVLSAGPDRLTGAGNRGIPQVVSVGALDMVNFGPMDDVPDAFADRTLHEHNPQVTLMRTTPEESKVLGQRIARKLNDATGPRAVVIPTEGISMLSVEGEPFYDPDADAALYNSLRANLDDAVELIEVATAINDEAFVSAVVQKLEAYLESMPTNT
ncbi:Tm-1-like ATP-binding domain-containing protein [Halocatena halophila]|uniref:Tm-1-like ATP-binding domain-containing protein n=1 Tax=Halocatena halophila TaxID=2814576 RepID=UPI002ED313C5